MRALQGVLLFLAIGLIATSAPAQDAGQRIDADKLQAAAMATIGGDVETLGPPLPRWRAEGTPYDPNQSLQPFAIKADRSIPTSGLMASPAEYEPVRGVLFYYASNMWPTVVRDLVVALTADPGHDEIAYVVVPNSYQQTHATNAFVAGGGRHEQGRVHHADGQCPVDSRLRPALHLPGRRDRHRGQPLLSQPAAGQLHPDRDW